MRNNYLLKKMLKKIKHRGPDSTKIVKIKEFGEMGFVRLAINDKTLKGMQPFKYNNLLGVFNGEVYNYNHLKEKYNFKLSSLSDTELLLPLYKKLGDNFYNEIDGMFSGVIFDYSNEEFTIIKDLISQKPLFIVWYKNKNFSIVSELKSIVRKDISEIKNISSGLTKLDINGKILYEKFNRLKIDINYEGKIENKINLLFNTIENAVIKRMPNEKFGVFLSGGLDSSIIASITNKYRKDVIYYSNSQ